MTKTPLIMYLFQIWQMQNIEQVYPEMVVTLLAPQNLYFFFKNAIYWKIDDIVMIGLGFAGHVCFSIFAPWGATKGRILWMKKKLMGMKKDLKAIPEVRDTKNKEVLNILSTKNGVWKRKPPNSRFRGHCFGSYYTHKYGSVFNSVSETEVVGHQEAITKDVCWYFSICHFLWVLNKRDIAMLQNKIRVPMEPLSNATTSTASVSLRGSRKRKSSNHDESLAPAMLRRPTTLCRGKNNSVLWRLQGPPNVIVLLGACWRNYTLSSKK